MYLFVAAAIAAAMAGQPMRAVAAVQTEAALLVRDVMMLSQFATLGLSREQVEKLLEIYAEAGPRLDAGTSGLQQLQELRQRLLRGEQVTPTEMRDVFRIMRELGRQGPGLGQGGQELLAKVLGVLKEWQKVVLVAPNGQRIRLMVRRKGENPFADVLVGIANVPEEQWAEMREQLARRASEAAAEEADREEVAENVREFLNRVHGMDEAQVRAKANELVEEANALVQTRVPLIMLLQPIDQEMLQRRAAGLFLNPRTPELLREMAEVRGWKVPEGK